MGGKGIPRTPDSPWCYSSLAYLKGRKAEVCSRSGYYDLSDQSQIFAVAEGSPPHLTHQSRHQTHDTYVIQLKYLNCHERAILPCWAVFSFSLQRKLSSLGKMSDMVKPLSS